MMPNQMLVYIERDMRRETKLAKDLSKLMIDLFDSVKERQSFIEELEVLKGNLVAYKSLEFLKKLQKSELLKVLGHKKMVIELQLQLRGRENGKGLEIKDSPPDHEWEQSLDMDDFDLRLTVVLYPCNNPHILSETTTNIQTIVSSQNPQVDNYIERPIRIIPGSMGIVQAATLCKIVDIREGVKECVMSTQEYIRKVVEDVGEDKDFTRGSWVNVVKSFTHSALGNFTVTLKELSSTISGSIHHKVLTEEGFGKAITARSALILHNVYAFTPK
uniref:Homologous recombination OB-fold protein OB-fold domain-containing protein n=1 Tax=Tanacetum cinerariifolium TaxID=118510 RepID=A0A699I150_TANCI|nr:hypothetical protein [Tanacetum cinerariifolium]